VRHRLKCYYENGEGQRESSISALPLGDRCFGERVSTLSTKGPSVYPHAPTLPESKLRKLTLTQQAAGDVLNEWEGSVLRVVFPLPVQLLSSH